MRVGTPFHPITPSLGTKVKPESKESVRCLSRLGNEEADIVPAHKQLNYIFNYSSFNN
jgi:hypothetical protein